ncbi:hypothetical protein HAU47_03620 [Weissella confusa]|uniref:hypothetical protein n=1 Tax=Weissella confusa TaxID=1583 RepID=UPI0018F165AC|nr:hypothetical protein [Weissella confusa]MBJ7619572.1 hypothetical protein [Weissella confusa]MBJ7667024.1 hypothetical protein [Weissella confusa]
MQGLGELTDLELEKKINAEHKDTISKKFGWDCDIMHPEAMVEATESVLARMDKLAEVIDVRENELYEADRTRILNMAKDLKEGDTVADLSARLTEFRTRLMFAPLRFYEGNREMLKKVAANIVDSYAIAGEDPVIEMALKGMRERTEDDLTAADYETVIKSFIRFVPAFRESNIRMLGQLIQSMHREAEVFGFANAPEIITFFQQLDIVVAGAIRPDEFMAITDMLNDFEPTITNRVVELAPLEVLHQFTMNVISGVNTAREQGLSFGDDADKRLEHAVTELNRGMLEREDYGNILRGIRSLHVES